jgi:hypothetical protein
MYKNKLSNQVLRYVYIENIWSNLHRTGIRFIAVRWFSIISHIYHLNQVNSYCIWRVSNRLSIPSISLILSLIFCTAYSSLPTTFICCFTSDISFNRSPTHVGIPPSSCPSPLASPFILVPVTLTGGAFCSYRTKKHYNIKCFFFSGEAEVFWRPFCYHVISNYSLWLA